MPSIAPHTIEIIAAAIFGVAVLHTFATPTIARVGARFPRHAGLWHLLGEVEVVFGLWAFVLVAILFALQGRGPAIEYIERADFTEALFVFVIMVIAASRPVLDVVGATVDAIARAVPINPAITTYFLALALIPLTGSLITEPAAMTLAALLLRDRFFAHVESRSARYATLGGLFVNVSIGGVLTAYAAPPVLMVADTWNWDTLFMLRTFGAPAAIAVVITSLTLTFVFRDDIARITALPTRSERVPWTVRLVHLAFLAAVVSFGHHPEVFLALFLFFLGFTEAYERHQSPLMLREGLLVAFFLAGLVALGGLQRWWLQDLMSDLPPGVLFWGAVALTAITDNAALTYLGSLVEGVDDAFKYALVSGAVTGGGLTVIANAPNPAGLSLLRATFADGVSPIGLLLGALFPTLVAAAAFLLW